MSPQPRTRTATLEVRSTSVRTSCKDSEVFAAR